MNWFEKIQRYYNLGCYTDEQVYKFVVAGKITEEQYKEIVGIKDEIEVDEIPETETPKEETTEKEEEKTEEIVEDKAE